VLLAILRINIRFSNSLADANKKAGCNRFKLPERCNREGGCKQNGIKNKWKKYIENKMNEENEWHREVSLVV